MVRSINYIRNKIRNSESYYIFVKYLYKLFYFNIIYIIPNIKYRLSIKISFTKSSHGRRVPKNERAECVEPQALPVQGNVLLIWSENKDKEKELFVHVDLINSAF